MFICCGLGDPPNICECSYVGAPHPMVTYGAPQKKKKRAKRSGTRIGKEEGKKYVPRATGDTRTDNLDGKTGLLTGLLAGKQGWKCPVALLATCCGSKSLKVILIDSDFRAYPVLNPLVTL